MSKNKIICFSESQILAEPDREPIENLSKRHKADSKTKSTETTEPRDEVQPSHLWQPLELWETCYIVGRGLWFTKYSGLPKEDVHNCDVLLVSVVVRLALMIESILIGKFRESHELRMIPNKKERNADLNSSLNYELEPKASWGNPWQVGDAVAIWKKDLFMEQH